MPAKACFHTRRSRARAARGPKARPRLRGRGRRERRRYRDDHCGQEISPIASPASAKPASCSAACTHFCSGEEHARPCQVHRTGAVTREPIPKKKPGRRPMKTSSQFPFSLLVSSPQPSMMAWEKDRPIEPRSTMRIGVTWSPMRSANVPASICTCVREVESVTWRWGQVCGVIELPESVVSRLSQGAMPQAPT